jgi:hypothetical protein
MGKHGSKNVLPTIHARDRVSHERAGAHGDMVQHEAEGPDPSTVWQSNTQEKSETGQMAATVSAASPRVYRKQSTCSSQNFPRLIWKSAILTTF